MKRLNKLDLMKNERIREKKLKTKYWKEKKKQRSVGVLFWLRKRNRLSKDVNRKETIAKKKVREGAFVLIEKEGVK